jgi:hypothetical protein
MVINNNSAEITTIYGMYNYASMACVCARQQTTAIAGLLKNND